MRNLLCLTQPLYVMTYGRSLRKRFLATYERCQFVHVTESFRRYIVRSIAAVTRWIFFTFGPSPLPTSNPYDAPDRASPEEAVLALGCSNPTALAKLNTGHDRVNGLQVKTMGSHRVADSARDPSADPSRSQSMPRAVSAAPSTAAPASLLFDAVAPLPGCRRQREFQSLTSGIWCARDCAAASRPSCDDRQIAHHLSQNLSLYWLCNSS